MDRLNFVSSLRLLASTFMSLRMLAARTAIAKTTKSVFRLSQSCYPACFAVGFGLTAGGVGVAFNCGVVRTAGLLGDGCGTG